LKHKLSAGSPARSWESFCALSLQADAVTIVAPPDSFAYMPKEVGACLRAGATLRAEALREAAAAKRVSHTNVAPRENHRSAKLMRRRQALTPVADDLPG